MSGTDLFVTVVYATYIIAPALRDEVWLRAALLLNSIGFATWGLLIGSWPVVGANVLFGLISLRALGRLLRERRPHELAPDLERGRLALFPRMTTRDFQTFWDMGTPVETFSGTITTLGEPVDHLTVLLDGSIDVSFGDGQMVVRHGPTLIGDVSFAADAERLATATVTGENLTLHQWPTETLRALESSHPTLVAPFLLGLSSELTRKVGSTGS